MRMLLLANRVMIFVFAVCMVLQHADGNAIFFRIDVLTTVLSLFALAITTKKWYTHLILAYCIVTYTYIYSLHSPSSLNHVSDFTDAILYLGLVLSTNKLIAWLTFVLLVFEIANGYENNSFIGEIANILASIYVINYLGKKGFVKYA